jgi:hypothetical protein
MITVRVKHSLPLYRILTIPGAHTSTYPTDCAVDPLEKKVKSLALTEHHAMKTYWGVEV